MVSYNNSSDCSFRNHHSGSSASFSPYLLHPPLLLQPSFTASMSKKFKIRVCDFITILK